MSYEQARRQALFLTDKMAYELNLTDDQYEAAYEINLDYLMGINDYNDLYGAYWQQRNLDLSYILLDWQYRAYLDATYFYRPLYWSGGYWHFSIYARYPHRDYFYFGRPAFITVYRGGHSWRMNGGRSWYNGRVYGQHRGNVRVGMRDGFNRGDYGRGSTGVFGNGINRNNAGYRDQYRYQNRSQQSRGSFGNGSVNNRNNSNYGNYGFRNRQSSTRSTVTRPEHHSIGSFGSRSNDNFPDREMSSPNGTFSPSRSRAPRSHSESTFTPSPRSMGSFGQGTRGNSGSHAPGPRSSGSSSFGGGNRGGSSFGGSSNSFGNRSHSMGGPSFGGGTRGTVTAPAGSAHFGSRR